MTDEHGACLAVFNVAVEVTERVRASKMAQATQVELEAANRQLHVQGAELVKRTEQAELERERTAGILDAMADAHCILDEDYRFTRVNAAMERSVGQLEAAFLCRAMWEVFPTPWERCSRSRIAG